MNCPLATKTVSQQPKNIRLLVRAVGELFEAETEAEKIEQTEKLFQAYNAIQE